MPIGTRHNANKVQMGASLVPASQCAVESVPGNIEAGLFVRRNTSTGAYQVAASGAGPIVGVSMGRGLGRAGTFALCYSSPKVLIQIGEHVPTVGTQVHVDNTSGKGAASGGSATATAGIYRKVLVGGGVDEITGAAVNVAIVDLTSGA